MVETLTAQTIAAHPLFANLEPHLRDDLLACGKSVPYKKNVQLFGSGDPVDFYYLICSGVIQITRLMPDGFEITTDIVVAGDLVAPSTLVRETTTYYERAQIVRDATLLAFPIARVRDDASRHATLALNIFTIASYRAHLHSVYAEHRATMTASQQIACHIQRLCALHNFNPAGFTLPYSKSLIAAGLGMELETFSRALAKLPAQGVMVRGAHAALQDRTLTDEKVCQHCSWYGSCKERQRLNWQMLGDTSAATGLPNPSYGFNQG